MFYSHVLLPAWQYQTKTPLSAEAIQLVAVVNASIVESSGIDAVLTPLVDDVKNLERVCLELNSIHTCNHFFIKEGFFPQVLTAIAYCRVYTSLLMGIRESFEELLGLRQRTTWPASCLGGTNNFRLHFAVAAIVWPTVTTCVFMYVSI